MNSLSQLLIGSPNLSAPAPGDAPPGAAVLQPGAFARSLTDARAALGTAAAGQGGGHAEPAAAPSLPATHAPAMGERADAGISPQKPALPGLAAPSFTGEAPHSLAGMHAPVADPALAGAAVPATLPGLPQPQTQPAPAPELDAADGAPAAAATDTNLPAMLSAEARGPWALRLAVRTMTTEGTGQGSPGGNGLPPLGPEGGKALPDLPPVRPLPAGAGAEAVKAAPVPAMQPGAVAAAEMLARAAERDGKPSHPGVTVPQAPAMSATPISTATSPQPDQTAARVVGAVPAAAVEGAPPPAQEASGLARMVQDRGALPEGRVPGMHPEGRLPSVADSGLRPAQGADGALLERAAPAGAQSNGQGQPHLPGALTATAQSQAPASAPAPAAQASASAPQAAGSTVPASPASAAASAAPPPAAPEGLAERAATTTGQSSDGARQLGAVELRALDPTAHAAADGRRLAGADLPQQVQPGLRQDMAAQVDGGMVAAVIDRRNITEAAGQRRGAEQLAGVGAESVDRSPSTGAEAAEQLTRPQTARPVVPVLAARDMAALAERIEMLVHRRNGVANVNLTLSELGDVEISVRLESKQAHVQFLVQDTAARESLEAQLPRLRALLSEGGLELGDIGMNMRERSGGENGGERGDQPQGTSSGAVADGGGVEEASPRRRAGGGDHVLDAFA